MGEDVKEGGEGSLVWNQVRVEVKEREGRKTGDYIYIRGRRLYVADWLVVRP